MTDLLDWIARIPPEYPEKSAAELDTLPMAAVLAYYSERVDAFNAQAAAYGRARNVALGVTFVCFVVALVLAVLAS